MKQVLKFLKDAGVYYLATCEDDRFCARKAMLDDYPELRAMYDENDGNTQVLYFTHASAKFASFGKCEWEDCEW